VNPPVLLVATFGAFLVLMFSLAVAGIVSRWRDIPDHDRVGLCLGGLILAAALVIWVVAVVFPHGKETAPAPAGKAEHARKADGTAASDFGGSGGPSADPGRSLE